MPVSCEHTRCCVYFIFLAKNEATLETDRMLVRCGVTPAANKTALVNVTFEYPTAIVAIWIVYLMIRDEGLGTVILSKRVTYGDPKEDD